LAQLFGLRGLLALYRGISEDGALWVFLYHFSRAYALGGHWPAAQGAQALEEGQGKEVRKTNLGRLLVLFDL
jgi:hypothetical protein